MNTEQIKNILRNIFDKINSSEKAQIDKNTNWQIDDKVEDLESEY